ncbi:hypothetical protein [Spongiibacter marinus]|uniref:hypothetical protein n=1 Tax=Spongiibacter marinus TaxID=354246 RepID=UPI003C4E2689
MVDATLAPSAAAAQQILRDSSQFQWYVIPLMVVVIYLYSEQWHARRWSVILGGLAFWLMDWVNEIWNGLVLHFSGYAPVWGAPSDTAFLILAGLNIEISLMFAVLGLAAMLTLPRDPKAKILGVNNRVVWAATNAALSVLVEIYLNHIGALVWEWPFWNAASPWLIFLLGYLPFYLVGAWVHDMPSRRRQVVAVSGLGTFVAASLILFVPVLGWL